MNGTLDQDAVNLAKAIRQVESNKDPKARGASGEFGYYQFMPQTWASSSKAFLGRDVPIEQATPEEQNEVAYKQIKQWKDAGYNPGQIASMWNAGPGKPNAYIDGNKGVNEHGVEYDTKAYAENVAKTYQQIKGSGAGGGGVGLPYTSLNVPEQAQGEYKGVLEQQPVLGTLGEKLSGRVQDIADTFQQPSLTRGLLRSVGAVAGGVGDVTGAAISAAVPDFIEKPVTEGIGKFVAGIPGVKEGAEAYGKLDPELQKDLGAVGNIASLIPIGKGAAIGVGATKGFVPSVVRTASEAEGFVGDMARRSLVKEAAEIVSPKQTAKVSKTGIKSGRGEKSGFLGEISVTPDARTQRAAEASAGIVKKGNTMTENANALRGEISKTAEQLKSDLGKMEVVPLVQKEEMDDLLNRALQEIGENPTMVGDAGKSAELILKKFQSFLPKGDITALDLLEARKKLDTWMDSLQAGNVFNPNYESAKTVALRAIRQGANDLIALKAPDVAVKESLARQSALFDALENVSQKAASEVGTNVLERFGKKHPGIRGLINMTAQGLGIGTGINLLDGR